MWRQDLHIAKLKFKHFLAIRRWCWHPHQMVTPWTDLQTKGKANWTICSIGVVFPIFSCLDARIEYFPPQVRILSRFFSIYSNSEVHRSASRSKYQDLNLWIFFFCRIIQTSFSHPSHLRYQKQTFNTNEKLKNTHLENILTRQRFQLVAYTIWRGASDFAVKRSQTLSKTMRLKDRSVSNRT